MVFPDLTHLRVSINKCIGYGYQKSGIGYDPHRHEVYGCKSSCRYPRTIPGPSLGTTARLQYERSLVHIHPHAIETYEILEGEMEFFIKNKWISAIKGDQLIVPKGVHHAFRNPSGKMVKVFNTHQLAFRMEQYFEEVCLVLDKLTEKQTKDFTMNFNAKLYMGLLMNRFRHEILAKDPPDVMIQVLGIVGKWMGLTY